VLQALLRRLGSGSRFFVEFGAGSGEQANCVLLADHFRWRGVFIERDDQQYRQLESRYRANRRIHTRQAAITPANVEELFAQAGVPAAFDVLSVDVDGNDYWIWKALDAFRPRVVVIEYNGALPLDRRLVMPHDDRHTWDGTDYFGASLGAYLALGTVKGYELAHLDANGVNAFFVSVDELTRLSRRQTGRRALAGGVRLPPDPHRRPFVDLDTGQLVKADRRP